MTTEQRERGEVVVDVEGRAYTLVLDINAIAELEELLSTPEKPVVFQDVITRVEAGSVSHVRAMVWAAMRRHHRELTLAQVGAWIQRVGLDVLNEKLGEIASSSQPDPRDIAELGLDKKTRPRRARAS